jgi:hypothetical protein
MAKGIPPVGSESTHAGFRADPKAPLVGSRDTWPIVQNSGMVLEELANSTARHLPFGRRFTSIL